MLKNQAGCWLVVVVVAHPLISALGSQRQADLYEFEASLVYRVKSRSAKATQRYLENKWEKGKKKKKEKKVSSGWHSERLKDKGRKFGVSHVGGGSEMGSRWPE